MTPRDYWLKLTAGYTHTPVGNNLGTLEGWKSRAG
jgi:hypothetical protein